MRESIKTRLERLEAARRPPEPEQVWTVGVNICEWKGGGYGLGRVLAHIPPRLIVPGEPIDYRDGLEELLRAWDEASAAHGDDGFGEDYGDMIPEELEEDEDDG